MLHINKEITQKQGIHVPEQTQYSEITPYSLSINEASRHFGLAVQTFYNMINIGKITQGIHYLKIGRKVVIVRDKFIEWMEAQDGDLFEK